jgi:hypothetical protein
VLLRLLLLLVAFNAFLAEGSEISEDVGLSEILSSFADIPADVVVLSYLHLLNFNTSNC